MIGVHINIAMVVRTHLPSIAMMQVMAVMDLPIAYLSCSRATMLPRLFGAQTGVRLPMKTGRNCLITLPRPIRHRQMAQKGSFSEVRTAIVSFYQLLTPALVALTLATTTTATIGRARSGRNPQTMQSISLSVIHWLPII